MEKREITVMRITWIIMPVLGGLIGWLTNVVAIKMLFWPKKPIRIPLTSFEFIGLLPKRRSELAASIGQAIDENLLPIDEVLAHIDNNDYQKHLVDAVTYYVDQRLIEILPRILPQSMKTLIRDYLKDIIQRESEQIIGQVAVSTMEKVKQTACLGTLVEEKIQSFDLDQLEELIKGISSTELKHIELLGAVLGFFIGIIQALFVYWGYSI